MSGRPKKERGWGEGVGRGGGGGGEREKKEEMQKGKDKGSFNFSSHLNPLSLCQSSPNPLQLDACCEGFGKVRTTDLL